MKILTTFLIILFSSLTAYSDEYVVIVNKGNALTSITKAQLKFIYSGKMRELNGVQIVPIDLSTDSPAAAAFLRSIMNMGPEQYKEFWVSQQVKGAGTAPMVQKSSEAIVAIISQLPGAIGYVEAGKVTDAVKVIPVN